MIYKATHKTHKPELDFICNVLTEIDYTVNSISLPYLDHRNSGTYNSSGGFSTKSYIFEEITDIKEVKFYEKCFKDKKYGKYAELKPLIKKILSNGIFN